MSRVRGGRRGGRLKTASMATLIVLAVLAAGIGLYLLSGPLIAALHDVTGGSWGADAALGVFFALGPLVIAVGYAWLAHRRGWRPHWGWLVVILYLPALTLAPWSRSGTNAPLDHEVNRRLPGLLGGMVGGFGALMALFAVLWLTAIWRKRAARP